MDPLELREPPPNKSDRYDSRLQALKELGLIYIVAEKIFWYLALLSLANWRWRLARFARGHASPKIAPAIKDTFKLFFFGFFGVLLPFFCSSKPIVFYNSWLDYIIGWYVIILVLQHHINVLLFDQFRSDQLPLPKKTNKAIFTGIDKIADYIMPIDEENLPMNIYRLTSRKRRVILAAMDFWLIYISFSLIYLSIKDHFNPIYSINSLKNAIYYSVVSGSTLGYGDITPIDSAQNITLFQVFTSLFFIVLVLSYSISLISQESELASSDKNQDGTE